MRRPAPAPPLKTYTSLLAFNRPLRSNEQDNQIDHQLEDGVNILVAKTVSIILAHVVSIYSAILVEEFFFFSNHPPVLLQDLLKYLSIAYLLFYVALLTCHRLRSQWPYNLLGFSVYTLLTAALYATTLVAFSSSSSPLDFIRHALLLVALAQLVLISFCLVQSKFSVCSAPIHLVYIYVFSLLACVILVFLLILDYCLRRHAIAPTSLFWQHYLTAVAVSNNKSSTNATYDRVTIDTHKIGIGMLFALLFVIYEVYDLRRAIRRLVIESCGEEQRHQALALAFNLISADYLKISLEFLFKLIK